MKTRSFDEMMFDLVEAPSDKFKNVVKYRDNVRADEDRLRRIIGMTCDSDLWRIGLLSGTVEKVLPTPQSSLNPRCTLRQRRQVALGLEAMLIEGHYTSCIGAVVTTGVPVELPEVSQRLDEVLDPMRRLNAFWKRRDAPYELALRSCELAFQRKNGRLKIHVHGHLVILSKDDACPGVVAEIEADLERHFGGRCCAMALGCRPGDAQFSRYILKPIPLDPLADDEIRKLHTILRRRRLIHPMGPLKAALGELKRSRKRLVRDRAGQVVRCPLRTRVLEPEDAVEGKDRKRETDLDEGHAGEVGPRSVQGKPNVAVSLSLPMRTASGWREPTVLVLKFDGNVEKFLKDHPFLKIWRRDLLKHLSLSPRESASLGIQRMVHVPGVTDTPPRPEVLKIPPFPRPASCPTPIEPPRKKSKA